MLRETSKRTYSLLPHSLLTRQSSTLGGIMKGMRFQAGLTLIEHSKLLGVSKSKLSRIEIGEQSVSFAFFKVWCLSQRFCWVLAVEQLGELFYGQAAANTSWESANLKEPHYFNRELAGGLVARNSRLSAGIELKQISTVNLNQNVVMRIENGVRDISVLELLYLLDQYGVSIATALLFVDPSQEKE